MIKKTNLLLHFTWDRITRNDGDEIGLVQYDYDNYWEGRKISN